MNQQRGMTWTMYLVMQHEVDTGRGLKGVGVGSLPDPFRTDRLSWSLPTLSSPWDLLLACGRFASLMSAGSRRWRRCEGQFGKRRMCSVRFCRTKVMGESRSSVDTLLCNWMDKANVREIR